MKPNGSKSDSRYYVCLAVEDSANRDVPSPHVFRSLEDAAVAVRADGKPSGDVPDRANISGGDGTQLVAIGAPERLRISFVDQPNASLPLDTKPRYRFFYDTHLLGKDGDGTERDPWPDVPAALAGLAKMYDEGRVKAGMGDQIELSKRKVFTASSHEKRKQRIEFVVRCLLSLVSMLLVTPVILIFSYLLYQAWPALSWSFLTLNPADGMTAGGIWAPLVGTFCLVLMSLLIAAPIGVLAGVYLNEYARDNWFTRLINLAVVNLAGVPSIVHALFGVGAFVITAGMGRSLLAAACTLAVMTLPVIITSTREALSAVPMSFREACWNMGASKWQTIRTIVLPNSISGILTGVILQVSRAAGETAPILFTGAAFYLKVADSGWGYYFPYAIDSKVMALSYHLFALRTQANNVPPAIEFGTAVVLIGLVLTVNSASIAFRMYLRSRKKW